ncbi:hypothetical protein OK074_0193 [Actinobacteria bacterium OK074]|nr:hypothetical protein OK074_0193 [Actinobacteria bacterium OK074]
MPERDPILLTVADVTAALKGVRRIYFSMSLSPYNTDAGRRSSTVSAPPRPS